MSISTDDASGQGTRPHQLCVHTDLHPGPACSLVLDFNPQSPWREVGQGCRARLSSPDSCCLPSLSSHCTFCRVAACSAGTLQDTFTSQPHALVTQQTHGRTASCLLVEASTGCKRIGEARFRRLGISGRAGAAVTKHQRKSSLNSTNLLSHSSGG